MIAYLIAGGPVMVPILACSIAGMAVTIERVWALRRARVAPRDLVSEVAELVKQRRWAEATRAARARDAAAARLIAVALHERHQPRAVLKERLEEVGRREAAEMERHLAVLGTIASVAPLLGLLGTVGGMIVTFEGIEVGGMANMGTMAGGIAQALITTFAGLTVAIPALLVHRWLLARVDRNLLELEEISLDLLQRLVDAHADSPPSRAAEP